MTENDLLDQAIEAFQRETGLSLSVIQSGINTGDYWVDAVVELPRDGGRLFAEVKNWAQQANLGALVEQVKRQPGEGLLIADYVNPKMAKKLKDQGVQFIDLAGNAYINQPPLYVHVVGNRLQGRKRQNGMTNRAFDVAGLKVVFALLCEPELVAAPYRMIAEETGVALGTVGKIINDLKNAGFIVDIGRHRGRRLVNLRRLLDRWVEVYPEKLKPKLRVGEFINDDPYWWKEFNIEKCGAYWGGEAAAAKSVGYLKPEVITIYLPEHAGAKLMGQARLRKAVGRSGEEQGIVRIYRPFWPIDKEKKCQDARCARIVHPILIYADLVATGDGRNLEAARMIYDRDIAEHFRED